MYSIQLKNDFLCCQGRSSSPDIEPPGAACSQSRSLTSFHLRELPAAAPQKQRETHL